MARGADGKGKWHNKQKGRESKKKGNERKREKKRKRRQTWSSRSLKPSIARKAVQPRAAAPAIRRADLGVPLTKGEREGEGKREVVEGGCSCEKRKVRIGEK